MKMISWLSRLIISAAFFSLTTVTQAGTPLWTFTPLTATTISIPANESTIVQYRVTNQSKRNHTLTMKPIPGISQITTSGNCPNPFILSYQQSCMLTLQITGSALQGNTIGGPEVCQQNSLQCYQPSLANSLNITVANQQIKTVGGTVSGLIGTVVLQNNGSDSLSIGSNGSFTFPTPVEQGSSYNVTVQTQPATQTCTVSNGSGTMGTSDVTNVVVTCTTNTHTLGGTVSGLVGTVVLQNNGSDSLSISSNSSFTFPTPVEQGSNYNVTVQTQPTTQTCVVSNGSGTMGSSDVTNVVVTCLTDTHTVGGTVSGLIGTVVLQNNGSDSLSMSTDGSFTFPIPVAEGSTYNVTVQTQPATQTCSVSNGSGTMGDNNITNVTVTCSTNTHTVGGTISGLSGTVVLQNNGGDSLSRSVNGSFTFSTPVAQGSTYNVTVQTQPATQTCSVSNGSGTIGTSDITNVTVTCSTNTHTVGGTISGLVGTVVLQNNGGDSLSRSVNGAFTFSTPVAQGSTYNVTVQTQPAAQTCTVSNGSGTIGASDITNVLVTCVTNNTTLSVSATGTIPVNGGSGTLTVTNTGTTFPAINVHAILPGAWVEVTQDSSACTLILPNGGTCQLSFSSTAAYVAQGGISVTGDNITSPPTTSLAFTIDGYLVFSILSATTADVIASSDASTSINWSTDQVFIPGITETSTVAGGDACNGATDGICNTQQIFNQYGTPFNTYAAGLCYGITSDNTGAVPAGTWYLPAVCQLGRTGQLAGCAAGLPNIDINLVSLGFGGLAAQYWSSTEYSTSPTSQSWFEFYSSGSFQNHTIKISNFGVRCARVMNY